MLEQFKGAEFCPLCFDGVPERNAFLCVACASSVIESQKNIPGNLTFGVHIVRSFGFDYATIADKFGLGLYNETVEVAFHYALRAAAGTYYGYFYRGHEADRGFKASIIAALDEQWTRRDAIHASRTAQDYCWLALFEEVHHEQLKRDYPPLATPEMIRNIPLEKLDGVALVKKEQNGIYHVVLGEEKAESLLMLPGVVLIGADDQTVLNLGDEGESAPTAVEAGEREKERAKYFASAAELAKQAPRKRKEKEREKPKFQKRGARTSFDDPDDYYSNYVEPEINDLSKRIGLIEREATEIRQLLEGVLEREGLIASGPRLNKEVLSLREMQLIKVASGGGEYTIGQRMTSLAGKGDSPATCKNVVLAIRCALAAAQAVNWHVVNGAKDDNGSSDGADT